VRRLERTSEDVGAEVWVKEEERCGAWGGNKVRKLEHIFHELRANEIEDVVAWGVGTSNWVAACAWHGAMLGFRVRVGVGGRIPKTYRDLYEQAGTRVVALPHIGMAPLAAAMAVGVGRTRLLPVGGSGGVGDLGAARAGAEIADAVRTGQMPTPQRVFVAMGTCGTVAGIALGSLAEGLSFPVTAVKVADWPYASRSMLARRVKRLTSRLDSHGIASGVPSIDIETRYLGSGYGHPTPASRAAIARAREDDVHLEGTYAAKAFAALLDHAKNGGGPYLFVDTSPGEPPSAEVAQ
jgi:D-cysteine desulfhydrase